MTEQELRNKVAGIILGWKGKKESNGSHKSIIDLYNSHKPLARGYKVKYTDAWCATAVSAVFIQAGLTDIAPTECSCPRMIDLYKQKGRWQENDNYKPQVGDVIMYDWQDSGSGDNTGVADHVGIVTAVNGNAITVAEGNMNDAVGTRTLAVGGKFIRGYCLPDYAKKATVAAPAKPQAAKPQTTTPKNVDYASSFSKAYAKTYTVTASALNMRTGASTKKSIIKALPRGSKVNCYGYYSISGTTTWLLVQDSTGQTGFCSLQYLK